MDLWGLTIAVFRRWYVTLPLLAITVTTALWVGQRVQAEYEVVGSVLLVAPPQTTPNPFADDHASEILGIGVGSSSTREEMLSQGFSDMYELDFERGSPIMSMRVISSSEALTVATAQEIVARLDDALREGQTGRQVPSAARVTMDIVDAPDAAEPVISGRLRLTAVVAVAGGILSLACALLADVFLLRRRERAPRVIAGPAGAPPTSPNVGKQRTTAVTSTPATVGRQRGPTSATAKAPSAGKQRVPTEATPKPPNGKQRGAAATKRPARGRERRPAPSKS